jgi:hypothetical protein
MDGNIDVLINRLNDMGSILKKNMERPLLIAGEVVRTNIVKGIRGQKYNFKPLAPSTVEQKARQKHSNLILIAQGDYMGSFTVEQRDWDEVHIGTNHNQGRALEFGYKPRNLPARPHVGPGLEESREKIKDILEDGFKQVFE